ncbi:cytosine deaminase [Bauldia sp.]|uniref:cytosine deaminase n=1 Tax=Bauldia sp. TaxID=2575872 RepID=UPI003BA955C3
MDLGFAALPHSPRFAIVNTRVPAVLLSEFPDPPDGEGLAAVDIVVNDGVIESVNPPGSQRDFPHVDLDWGMTWPTFVDMHTHIDKGHIWPRQPNPDGTFDGAIEATHADRSARWSASDVSRRMDFSLRTAYAHGTSLLRTHLDSAPPQHRISWPVFAEMRDKWADRIALQAVSLLAIDHMQDATIADEIVDTVAEYGGVLGVVTFMVPDLDKTLDDIMRRAADRGLDLDFHVDESADPNARSLHHIAEAAIRNNFPGRIVAGHCCSLARQPEPDAEATMARVAEAGISVVSLPMCNMYLQGRRAGATPYWRGTTLVHELAARDVPVAIASDNTRDPFYAYGDMDMIEVLREAVRILHLDHPIGGWADRIAKVPADIISDSDHGRIAIGRPADLVLFRARTWTELLSRPQADRTVLRDGLAIDRTLPDYRELDDLMGNA